MKLYHGSSTLFLESIRSYGLGGRNPLSEVDGSGFGRAVLEAVGAQLDELTYSLFDKMCNQTSNHFNFQHGDTYVSPSRLVAARYAASNRYGSEFLSHAFELFTLLDAELAAEIDCRFPVLAGIRQMHCSPLLFAFDYEPHMRLLTEHGGSAERQLAQLRRDLGADPESAELFHQQTNFRLASPVPFNLLTMQHVHLTGKATCGFPEFSIT